MTEREIKVLSIGHYSMIAMGWLFAALVAFQIVNTELHPPQLVQACPVPKEGR